MEGMPQTSFIPKKPIAVSNDYYGDRSFSIVTFVSVMIFLVAVTLSFGVYFYRGLLEKQLASATEDFKRAENSFAPDTIKNLQRFDQRITQSQKLIDNHVSMSSLLSLLEKTTVRQVQFNDFSVTTSASSPNDLASIGGVKISLKGLARGYGYVVRQSDQFTSAKDIKDTIFSDLQLDAQTGNVSFSVTASVDPSVLRYRDSVSVRVDSSQQGSVNQ